MDDGTEVGVGADPHDTDTDDDGILDGPDGLGDEDGDGIINVLDPLEVEGPVYITGGRTTCSHGGPGAVVSWGLLMSVLAGLRRRKGVIAASLLIGASASAQDPSHNAQRFDPMGMGGGFVQTPTARFMDPGEVTGHLIYNYAWRPLHLSTLQANGTLGSRNSGIEHLSAVHLGGAVGITPAVQMGIRLPAMQVVSTTLDNSLFFGDKPPSLTAGDITVDLGLRLNSEDRGPGLTLTPFMSIPTGTSQAWLSHGVTTAGGRLALSDTYGPFQWAAWGGYRSLYRAAATFGTVAIDDEVLYGAAMGLEIDSDRLRLNVEGFGSTIVGQARTFVPQGALSGALHTAAELDSNLLWHLDSGVLLTLGGGAGLTPAAGVPIFRATAGVGWAPKELRQVAPGDLDGDTIIDDLDLCVDEPEDFDGYRDEDGCPDMDNDLDRILDVRDTCPDEPEDIDGWKDADGCPDLDNDGDGLRDGADRCPDVAEDFDGDRDEDGCPEHEGDRDSDGLLDSEDECPEDPEDFDEWQDLDGCPEYDNDLDTIVDPLDTCPNSPENFNGVLDGDGCPDDMKAVVVANRIVILERILFYVNEARIKPESLDVVDAVVSTLLDNPDIERVRVEGHTDSDGSELYNLDLSRSRAEAIMAYLIEHGVEASRLEARGYGELYPIEDNDSDAGKQANRRVEFVILDQ